MIHLPIYLCIVIIPDHSANDELPEIRSIFGECDMPAQLNNNSLESFSPTSGSRMPRSSQPHLQRQFLTTAQKQRENFLHDFHVIVLFGFFSTCLLKGRGFICTEMLFDTSRSGFSFITTGRIMGGYTGWVSKMGEEWLGVVQSKFLGATWR